MNVEHNATNKPSIPFTTRRYLTLWKEQHIHNIKICTNMYITKSITAWCSVKNT